MNQKETILWAVKIGDPDHMEEILYSCKGWVNKDEVMAKGKEWADKNGYDRLRIAEIDLSVKPDFNKAINI